ncbi:hypothetical protein LB557_08295 [Mesorhizobium sp. BR115XR7A]|uniref:hypothetical protein n=1 Tax=Mesorhizobium sp. BR115XR7A TaxID=2876645 RepID=UPI001CC99000|nr:hypothetical protein [Mesorhizobium sp. BR115XR7A]MBZ9905995.1 hypothetical protein [Mesorhizobium sp. BR115XR7A]MBZ9931558.1 hypothetical protein [Mesorhizobium sp. BR1-1-5]
MKSAAKRRGSLRKVLGGIAAAIATTPDRRAEQGASTASMVAEWPLPPSATLGSSLRLKGIEREVRARLPWTVRKFAKAETGRIVLRMLQADADAFRAASATISKTLEGIEALAVLPREAEDILTISSRERHKWLRDGRLKSIGTRTVKMRGRSKAVTFHVFDPRHIEDLLDRDLATAWREEDARETSENRRRGAGKAALTRAGKRTGNARKTRNSGKDDAPKLEGWDTFEAEGLLR